MYRIACVLVCLCGVAAGPATAREAQEQEQRAGAPLRSAIEGIDANAAIDANVSPLAANAAATIVTPSAARRPPALVPMYVSLAALNALDFATTSRALSSGAGQESNPLMKPIVGNRAAFLAVKAGSAVGTIWMTERLRKRHPRAAVVLMAATNGLLTAVVAHNMRVRRP